VRLEPLVSAVAELGDDLGAVEARRPTAAGLAIDVADHQVQARPLVKDQVLGGFAVYAVPDAGVEQLERLPLRSAQLVLRLFLFDDPQELGAVL